MEFLPVQSSSHVTKQITSSKCYVSRELTQIKVNPTEQQNSVFFSSGLSTEKKQKIGKVQIYSAVQFFHEMRKMKCHLEVAKYATIEKLTSKT